MDEVTKDGRTVVFVSHQMDLSARICESAILLRDGHIDKVGPAREVVDCYLHEEQTASGD